MGDSIIISNMQISALPRVLLEIRTAHFHTLSVCSHALFSKGLLLDSLPIGHGTTAGDHPTDCSRHQLQSGGRVPAIVLPKFQASQECLEKFGPEVELESHGSFELY